LKIYISPSSDAVKVW